MLRLKIFKIASFGMCLVICAAFVTCAVICSCSNNQTLDTSDNLFPIIDSIYVPLNRDTYVGNKRIIRTYVIDGCEYIGSVQGYNHDILTHKGNCEFCKSREDN